ncbi:MAG: hypothetical protein JSU94_05075 [Phycisphaerales bacterium]|nr:MAG: hypothetical protein JSU94_05075 [Phycisphaerales bacterium]
MSHLGPLLVLLCSFSATAAAAAPGPFASKAEKQAFLTALTRQDARYDPQEKMIRRPYSSPGYHTTLKGGYVHPTRDSLAYAAAAPNCLLPDSAMLRRPRDKSKESNPLIKARA